ncbi:NAD(P)-dependent oxidoreductase [Novosphingobium sp. Leaf2]|uniref:NAD(P)-dependent oxidoreductase n=1 Tax=Novosphingobium sp. Leaf2 TaxID=1735670 RepID=UPI0006FD1EAC|nr:6-phosphogluconate dehydrogenase [Novosphingobium sp. Leaf2]
MAMMTGLIGFGEAGRTFMEAGDWVAGCRVYDIKTDRAETRGANLADYAASQADGRETMAEIVNGADLLLSLVTADQALAAAEAAAADLSPGTLYCDMNSIAPQTKQAAAHLIEAVGGHYVDVAVMAPVDPARLAVPLLLSGARAQSAAETLAALGFSNIRVVGDRVGRASSIKMIRSVMVKGLEALSAECVLAAEAAGVREEVIASLDASEKPKPWDSRVDYNLDRMMVHGLRRAAEMEEVVKTLDGLSTGSVMTRGTVERQRTIGALGLIRPDAGLPAKIEQIDAAQMSAKGKQNA